MITFINQTGHMAVIGIDPEKITSCSCRSNENINEYTVDIFYSDNTKKMVCFTNAFQRDHFFEKVNNILSPRNEKSIMEENFHRIRMRIDDIDLSLRKINKKLIVKGKKP